MTQVFYFTKKMRSTEKGLATIKTVLDQHSKQNILTTINFDNGHPPFHGFIEEIYTTTAGLFVYYVHNFDAEYYSFCFVVLETICSMCFEDEGLSILERIAKIV